MPEQYDWPDINPLRLKVGRKIISDQDMLKLVDALKEDVNESIFQDMPERIEPQLKLVLAKREDPISVLLDFNTPEEKAQAFIQAGVGAATRGYRIVMTVMVGEAWGLIQPKEEPEPDLERVANSEHRREIMVITLMSIDQRSYTLVQQVQRNEDGRLCGVVNTLEGTDGTVITTEPKPSKDPDLHLFYSAYRQTYAALHPEEMRSGKALKEALDLMRREDETDG